MGRKEAREIALHMVFEQSFRQPDDTENILERLEREVMDSLAGDVALYAGELPEDQKTYIRNTVLGVCAHSAELDAVVSAHSTNWSITRLSHMTRSILRLALYEIDYAEDVPLAAAINEAVELAKKYESEESALFINGVLGGVARDRQADQQPKKEAE